MRTTAPKGKTLRLPVQPGCRVVELTERMICGPGAVSSAAVAQGLWLAGVRAAAIFDPAATLHSEAWPRFPCVHHLRHEGWRPDLPVCFIASNHQQLADLCLVAHLAADRAATSVACVSDERLFESLGRFQPLRVETVAEVLGSPPPLDAVPAAMGLPSLGQVLEESFALSSEALGRPVGPLMVEHLEAAEYVIVVAGSAAGSVLAAVDLLRTGGYPFGAVILTQLRPFPGRSLGETLEGRRACLLMPSAISALDHELLSELRALTSSIQGSPELHCLAPASPKPSVTALFELIDRAMPGILSPALLKPETPAGTNLTIGVVPDSQAARDFLLEFASDANALGLGTPCLVSGAGVGQVLLQLGPKPPDAAQVLDLLLMAQSSARPDTESLDALRIGGSLVVHSDGGSPSQAWADLPESFRRVLLEKEVHFFWLDTALGGDLGKGQDPRPLLRGALLKVSEGPLRDLLGGSSQDSLLEKLLPSLPSDRSADLMRQGWDLVQQLDPPLLESSLELVEVDSGKGAGTVLMSPAPEGSAANDAWLKRLREFHLTGRSELSSAENRGALQPAAVYALASGRRGVRELPLCLSSRSGAGAGPVVQPLSQLLAEACEKAKSEGSSVSLLEHRIDDVAAAVASTFAAGECACFLSSKWDLAKERILSLLDVPNAQASALDSEIRQLTSRLPSEVLVVPLGRSAVHELCAQVIRTERASARNQLHERVRKLINRLGSLLQVDRALSPEARTSKALSGEVGTYGADLIDTNRLATIVPPLPGSVPLSEERRHRIDGLVTTLRKFLGQLDTLPSCFMIHAPSSGGMSLSAERVRLIEHNDGFQLAVGLFDGLVSHLVEAVRALRAGELEADGAFDPASHAGLLSRLEWQSCAAEELAALPPIIVAESAERLTRLTMGSFERMIRSGRPLYAIVVTPDILYDGDPRPGALSGYFPDHGYVAMAHREVSVLQSALIQPEHLCAGLGRLFRSLLPGVAIVSQPETETENEAACLRAVAAHYGRAVPCYSYEPELGDSWAARFRLQANPRPDQTWPIVELAVSGPEGTEGRLRCAFTFADAAAIRPSFREHFLVIPKEAWSPDQAELADYLDEYLTVPPPSIPYIWVVDPENSLQRAVLTREMAHACRDRRRAWHVLQELGGLDNAYVEKAVKETAERVTAEALVAQFEAIEKARLQGAAEVVEQLIRRLTGVEPFDQGELAAPAPPVAPAPAAPALEAQVFEPHPVPVPAVEPIAEEVEELEEAGAEPYIDSFLCTSCNDCLKVNPRLFKYNENNQAYIADASTGTFAQLVKAAEACPAQCIHPGVPRPGDKTATPEMIERAAAFR